MLGLQMRQEAGELAGLPHYPTTRSHPLLSIPLHHPSRFSTPPERLGASACTEQLAPKEGPAAHHVTWTTKFVL